MHKICLAMPECCTSSGCDLPRSSDFCPVAAVAPTTYHDVAYYDLHTKNAARRKRGAATTRSGGEIPSCDSADTSARHAWNRQMG